MFTQEKKFSITQVNTQNTHKHPDKRNYKGLPPLPYGFSVSIDFAWGRAWVPGTSFIQYDSDQTFRSCDWSSVGFSVSMYSLWIYYHFIRGIINSLVFGDTIICGLRWDTQSNIVLYGGIHWQLQSAWMIAWPFVLYKAKKVTQWICYLYI